MPRSLTPLESRFVDAYINHCQGFDDVRHYVSDRDEAWVSRAMAAIEGDELAGTWRPLARKIRFADDFDILNEQERTLLRSTFGEEVLDAYEDRAIDLVFEHFEDRLGLRARGLALLETLD